MGQASVELRLDASSIGADSQRAAAQLKQAFGGTLGQMSQQMGETTKTIKLQVSNLEKMQQALKGNVNTAKELKAAFTGMTPKFKPGQFPATIAAPRVAPREYSGAAKATEYSDAMQAFGMGGGSHSAARATAQLRNYSNELKHGQKAHSRFADGLTQTAYVFDDMQYGIRGVTNNILPMAAAFGPAGMAVGALATIAVVSIPRLIGLADATGKAQEAADKLATADEQAAIQARRRAMAVKEAADATEKLERALSNADKRASESIASDETSSSISSDTNSLNARLSTLQVELSATDEIAQAKAKLAIEQNEIARTGMEEVQLSDKKLAAIKQEKEAIKSLRKENEGKIQNLEAERKEAERLMDYWRGDSSDAGQTAYKVALKDQAAAQEKLNAAREDSKKIGAAGAANTAKWTAEMHNRTAAVAKAMEQAELRKKIAALETQKTINDAEKKRAEEAKQLREKEIQDYNKFLEDSLQARQAGDKILEDWENERHRQWMQNADEEIQKMNRLSGIMESVNDKRKQSLADDAILQAKAHGHKGKARRLQAAADIESEAKQIAQEQAIPMDQARAIAARRQGLIERARMMETGERRSTRGIRKAQREDFMEYLKGQGLTPSKLSAKDKRNQQDMRKQELTMTKLEAIEAESRDCLTQIKDRMNKLKVF